MTKVELWRNLGQWNLTVQIYQLGCRFQFKMPFKILVSALNIGKVVENENLKIIIKYT